MSSNWQQHQQSNWQQQQQQQQQQQAGQQWQQDVQPSRVRICCISSRLGINTFIQVLKKVWNNANEKSAACQQLSRYEPTVSIVLFKTKVWHHPKSETEISETLTEWVPLPQIGDC